MALKWGIISTGRKCNDFANVLNYLSNEEHKIIGVAASKKEKAEWFAQKHKIPKAFESYQDLAKDQSIDVVYIGTKNSAHYTLCKLVLSNRKHLLCEKPLCLKYKETEELVSMAKKHKLFLMEAVWSRCFPVYEEVSRLLASKAIGNVIYLTADFGVPISLIDNVKLKGLGEGTLYELGGDELQLAILVFGRNPQTISAVGHLNEYGVDESVNYVLKYEGKTASFCTHSQIKMDNSATIYGTEGRIKIKDPFWAPTVISVNDEEETTFPLPVIEGEKYITNSPGQVYQAREVRNCIIQGLLESPKMTHKDTLTIAKWQEDICKLIRSQEKD